MMNAERIQPQPMVRTEVAGAELSFRAVTLGILLAAILGAANAYLGLKAGMTVSATFPAAMIAIAAFRLPFMRGTVLEQNIVRTTATVGEALVAAAIFTLPAFVIGKVDGQPIWSVFHFWQSMVILGLGGLLGLFFIIIMRRTLTVDANLPFPESYACYEIIRAGQGQDAGAKYVFGTMGLGMILELLKNPAGFPLIATSKEFVLSFIGTRGLSLYTPLASPAIFSVGYIIGPRYAGLGFAGVMLGWGVIIPIAMAISTDPAITAVPLAVATKMIWKHEVRTIAVGAMFVASLHTLWGLRHSIGSAFRGALVQRGHSAARPSRLERDMNVTLCFVSAFVASLPLAGWYWYHSQSIAITLLVFGLTHALGFLLAVIGGWLCGVVGSSSQPVSGLTLTALIIVGTILFALGVVGVAGASITLTVAVVICSAAALSGTLIQELKIGQLLGATPWKMELAQIIGTIVVVFFAVYPMVLLHESTIATNLAAGLAPIGIGGESLPAPQAGLMAQVATAIMGGAIDWGLILIGMALSLIIIVLRIPGPMVIAVGMYLSLSTVATIFLGGLVKWWLDRRLARRAVSPADRIAAQNRGILLASGFIAGEALTGVLLAGVVMLFLKLATLNPAQWGYLGTHLSLSALASPTAIAQLSQTVGSWLALGVFLIVGWLLIRIPLRAVKK